jgi:hypothetical protein
MTGCRAAICNWPNILLAFVSESICLLFEKLMKLNTLESNRFAFITSNLNGGAQICKEYGIHNYFYTDGSVLQCMIFCQTL